MNEPTRETGLPPGLASFAHDVASADGVEAFGEASVLEMHDGRGATWRLGPDTAPTGIAHLTSDGSAELAVHPGARRQGLGSLLLAIVGEQAGPALQVWAHGDLPAARATAAAQGFTAGRVLLKLGRPLDPADLPDVSWPQGVQERAFRPGADDAAWLAVNARAFAGHPEQGRWTLADLQARQRQPWFDPAGFLLAVEDGPQGEVLLGFHWTKKTGAGLGEVYVLGVDPAAQGRRLGPALTTAGLRYLAAAGQDRVMLYVEESNAAALAIYARAGFTRWAVDVGYRRVGRTGPPAP